MALFVVWALLVRHLQPLNNSDRVYFDVIIVLGTPADGDGNPSPTMLSRVTEGVREYQRGVAPHIIMTGGPAHNRFVEAEVMARAAEAQGIPKSAIYIENSALDTIQNACYSTRMMDKYGWHSAEIVSSEAHLPRAAIIFSQYPIAWQMHAAPAMNMSEERASSFFDMAETIKTVRYLILARWSEKCPR